MIPRPSPPAPLFDSPALNARLVEAREFRASLAAPHNGTAGSINGAQAVTPKAIGAQCSTILAVLRLCKGNAGLTREELVNLTELPINVVTARVNEMLHRGVLATGGKRMSSKGVMVGVVKVAEETP